MNTFIEQSSNIWWGITTAIVVVAILYFIMYALLRGRRSFSPFSYLIAILLLPLLAFQCYLLFGAISVKHTCSEVTEWIDAFVPEPSPGNVVSREDLNNVTSQLVDAFPIVSKLVDADDIAHSGEESLGEAVTRKINTYLNWYIVRRVAWCIGGIVFGCVAIFFTTRHCSFDLDDLDGLNDLSFENMEDIGIID